VSTADKPWWDVKVTQADVDRLAGRVLAAEQERDEARSDLGRRIAELDTLLRNNQVRREEVEARHGDLLRENQRLIVAVTELLVASRALIAWLQNEEGEETNADLVDRMLRLQVAITKAEKLP
jgi:hypothetical protein